MNRVVRNVCLFFASMGTTMLIATIINEVFS